MTNDVPYLEINHVVAEEIGVFRTDAAQITLVNVNRVVGLCAK